MLSTDFIMKHTLPLFSWNSPYGETETPSVCRWSLRAKKLGPVQPAATALIVGTRTYVSHFSSVREMTVDFDRAHWVTDSPRKQDWIRLQPADSVRTHDSTCNVR